MALNQWNNLLPAMGLSDEPDRWALTDFSNRPKAFLDTCAPSQLTYEQSNSPHQFSYVGPATVML